MLPQGAFVNDKGDSKGILYLTELGESYLIRQLADVTENFLPYVPVLLAVNESPSIKLIRSWDDLVAFTGEYTLDQAHFPVVQTAAREILEAGLAIEQRQLQSFMIKSWEGMCSASEEVFFEGNPVTFPSSASVFCIGPLWVLAPFREFLFRPSVVVCAHL